VFSVTSDLVLVAVSSRLLAMPRSLATIIAHIFSSHYVLSSGRHSSGAASMQTRHPTATSS
jgi:hypothetical protein